MAGCIAIHMLYCDRRLGVGLGVAAGAQQALGRAGTARAYAGRRVCGRRGATAREAQGVGVRGAPGARRMSRRRGARMLFDRGAWGGRLGAPVRTWACQLGQLGARAPGLVFRPGFQLGDVFESPFELGS